MSFNSLTIDPDQRQDVAIHKKARMKRAVLVLIFVQVLIFGILGARAEVMAAQCSSYYISEVNIVSAIDTEPGSVHTYVGFGQSTEESEQKAVGSCSHARNQLEICLESDRTSGRNVLSDSADNSLHLKYMKAVKRFTGCS